MNINTNQTQTKQNLRSIQSLARLLGSQSRQQQRNRQLSMLQRSAEEIGTDL